MPRPSEVHVLTADLDAAPGDSAVLSEDELERAGRFHFERDRRRFVTGRSTLRQIVARYLDASPREIVFEYGPQGKPRVSESAISFNISHSGACALFAFATQFEIGVDVEQFDQARSDDEHVAVSFFSPSEVATLRSHSASSRSRAFLRCWTRKEAFIKARGDGLTLPLQDFDVSFAVGARPALLRTAWSTQEVEEWVLRDISGLCPGAVAALAARAPEVCVLHKGRIG
jgi:4'-phosphopantetheinyl transferase